MQLPASVQPNRAERSGLPGGWFHPPAPALEPWWPTAMRHTSRKIGSSPDFRSHIGCSAIGTPVYSLRHSGNWMHEGKLRGTQEEMTAVISRRNLMLTIAQPAGTRTAAREHQKNPPGPRGGVSWLVIGELRATEVRQPHPGKCSCAYPSTDARNGLLRGTPPSVELGDQNTGCGATAVPGRTIPRTIDAADVHSPVLRDCQLCELFTAGAVAGDPTSTVLNVFPPSVECETAICEELLG